MAPQSEADETGREFAARFGDAAFGEATDLLSEDGREAVVESFPEEFPAGPTDAEDALEQYWWGLYGQYGEFERVGDVSADDGEAVVELVFADGSETATVEADDAGVAGLSFSPAYGEPAYVDESAFSERDVTVDAGDVDLGGVLAVPEGDGPFPGVLLVHGAGIHDPDGTAATAKILRDLGRGLASEGVATLRYEKRLNDHEVPDENYTLDAVVTDDAVAAVDELGAVDEVADDAVFVAGHSQGGMTAPRVADRHGGVAGVVSLDGPADPIVDPDDMSFMRYDMEPDGNLSEEQEKQLEAQRETFQRIAEGDFEADETIMGKPGVWHRSVKNCDPTGTASSLDAPVFAMKTGRADPETQTGLYEFMREGYEEWRDADLPEGSRVEFYDDLDHYFQEGPTPATMNGLYFGGNVAAYVLADLAEWIHGVAGE